MNLSESQIQRYSRHLLLPEIGGSGQRRLMSGSVLIVGIGGLGSPAALYLAAAGVGVLGVMDSDAVELSNLQRQVIHSTEDIGVPKVKSAAARIRALNPEIRVKEHGYRLTAANAAEVVSEYDFVLDGTDNFESKFLLADACHAAGTPYTHAGVLQFDGQLMTVKPGETACYRCAFNAPPPEGAVPSCSQAGVLGVVAGVIGTLQATEALKFLLDQGALTTDRLLVYNALQGTFRTVPLRKNPECPLCGTHPTVSNPPKQTSEENHG
ncbi:MAG: HesA/MoeB/ThiF family protein [bacterium]